jgi:ribonuclease HII
MAQEYYDGIAGVDEVGRGALFGPVVAAAVILPLEGQSRLMEWGLTDSKKLSPLQRERLNQCICQGNDSSWQCSWQLGLASVAEIDRLNILQASLLAMKRAVFKLKPQPRQCLVDGKFVIPDLSMTQNAVIQGDLHCPPIAAASIVAKVWRDHLIERLARQYPGYDLAHNKGYGTAKHRQGLRQLGPSYLHRRSFAPVRNLLEP